MASAYTTSGAEKKVPLKKKLVRPFVVIRETLRTMERERLLRERDNARDRMNELAHEKSLLYQSNEGVTRISPEICAALARNDEEQLLARERYNRADQALHAPA